MAARLIRSTLTLLAAASALGAGVPALGTEGAEPEAEAWRIVCTLDGQEVLRREPVYRIWHAGEEAAAGEPAGPAAPGTTVCRWEALAPAAEPGTQDEAASAPVWEAPDLSWLSAAEPSRPAAEMPGPQRPQLVAFTPGFRAAPAALAAAHIEFAPATSAAAARAAWQRLATAHADLLAGRTPEIVAIDVSGIGVFHRVRLEVAGPDEAARLCAALAEEGCWLAGAG
jgi:hypothetical protein